MIRISAVLYMLFPLLISAQNLVHNPGFEQHNGCPDRPGQINMATYWVSPTTATPDYFNECSSGLDYGTEFNKKGGKIPHAGRAYAGLQFYNLNGNEFFEYIQTQLDTVLVAGQLYCIRAFVSPGKTEYAFRELGALLSVTEVRSQEQKKLKLLYTVLGNGEYLADQNRWTCISGIYRAKGNEKLLTIGVFSPADEFWNIHTQSVTDSLIKSAYYFVDDVSVEAVRDSI